MALFMGSGRVVPIVMTHFVNNQSKNGFIPSTESIVVTPDYGYTGLGQVTVEAIPSAYVLPSGTYTVTNSGTYDIKSKLSVSTPAMANPTWTAATLNSSAAKVVYSITVSSGFKSTSQSFSSSYTLPTVAGTTIIPSDTSQVAAESYKWTTGSIVVNAIPNTILAYKKIYEKTANSDEINAFLSNQTRIYSYMFAFQSNISNITGSNITIIDEYAFYYCSNLETISFPLITSVSNYCFESCSKLISAYLPSVTRINGYAFSRCYSLTTITAPNVSYIDAGAFGSCSSLATVNFPNLTSVGTCFSQCGLTIASFPLLSNLGYYYTFYRCKNLSIVNLPLVSSIPSYCFQDCSSSNFTSITLPACTIVHASAFYSCFSLQMISLPLVSNISGAYVFARCSCLTSVYLMNSSVALLSNSNAFNMTPMIDSSYTGTFGSIYVPSSLLTQYQTATNWSYFSSRFVGI